MKTLQVIISLFAILSFGACKAPRETVTSNKGFIGSIHKGKATPAELIKDKGEPKEKAPISTHPNITSFKYTDGEVFQVQDGKVVAKFRSPRPEETSLNYWRNLFKNVHTTFELNSSSTEHETLYELKAPSLGMAILYNEQMKLVIQVIEHADQ